MTSTPTTIVTGASSNHARSIVQFLKSVKIFEPSSRCIIYDLGLTCEQVENISKMIENGSGLWEIRRFDYSLVPDYFNIEVNAGEYAWKPVIISEVTEEVREEDAGEKRFVFWCDAGNKLTSSLDMLRSVAKEDGVFTAISSGNIDTWTHPGCLRYLEGSGLLSRNINSHFPNRNAACVGIDVTNDCAMGVISLWGELAKIKECIAPNGSSRANHRQDQALLTILYYDMILDMCEKNKTPFTLDNYIYNTGSVRIHCDID